MKNAALVANLNKVMELLSRRKRELDSNKSVLYIAPILFTKLETCEGKYSIRFEQNSAQASMKMKERLNFTIYYYCNKWNLLVR